MFIAIITFILLLLVLVLVHEWGHFFAARRFGVAVDEFGFGFPPRAVSFRRGQTTYSLNWLPLGGFVRLKGESGEERSAPDSFAAQRPWRRAVILLAGVAMNFILAYVLISGSYLAGITTALSDSELAQAHDLSVMVVAVVAGSPAAQAGVQPGDSILSINQQPFTKLPEVQNFIGSHGDQELVFQVKRNGTELQLKATPRALPQGEGRAIVGVQLVQLGTLHYPWYQALAQGGRETMLLTRETLKGFGGLFYNLVVQRQVPADVAGPVGIAVITGQVVSQGFSYLVQFASLLSLNLAIINILPFPALDGGRLLFVVIEKIRGRANNQRIETLVHNVGFALLIALVVLITYHDVARLWGS